MEPYVPKLNYAYPSKPDQHMLEMKYVHDLTLDTHYPFLDKSFGFRFMRGLVYLGIFTIVFYLAVLRLTKEDCCQQAEPAPIR